MVSNGEVSGFAAGVRVDDGMYNKVTGIYTHGNIGNDNSGDNGDGIALWNASKNTVEGNRVVNNGPYGGVSLVTGPYNSPNDPSMFATDNIVRNNVIDDNNVSPCTAGSVAVPGKCTPRSKVDGTALPRVDRGMLTVGGNDDGIRIEGPNVSGTKVSGNMVTGSGNIGPPPTPTGTPRCQGDVGNVDSVVTGNTSNHNGYGRATGSGINMFAMGVPQVIPAGHATMSGNTVMQNYSDGITLTSVCDGLPTDPLETCVPHANMIDNNNASGNRRNGILLDAKTHDNRLEANKVNSNGNIGISMLLALDYSGSGPVYPPIPGTGPMNNVLRMNTGTGNTTMDAVDPTPGCGTNSWIGNVFGTMNQHCVGEP